MSYEYTNGFTSLKFNETEVRDRISVKDYDILNSHLEPEYRIEIEGRDEDYFNYTFSIQDKSDNGIILEFDFNSSIDDNIIDPLYSELKDQLRRIEDNDSSYYAGFNEEYIKGEWKNTLDDLKTKLDKIYIYFGGRND